MNQYRDPSGLIAILRGLTPQDAVQVGEVLCEAGFEALEVPLNSPNPLESIGLLRKALPDDVRVGAGTVLTTSQVRAVHKAGAQLVVSPNTDPRVIEETVALGLDSCPGVATVSEAFTAVQAGARTLKVFPANQVGEEAVGAWRTVLPEDVELIPVGGVHAASLHSWVQKGATGFGIGSALYRPEVDVEHMRRTAQGLVAAWKQAAEHLRPLPA